MKMKATKPECSVLTPGEDRRLSTSVLSNAVGSEPRFPVKVNPCKTLKKSEEPDSIPMPSVSMPKVQPRPSITAPNIDLVRYPNKDPKTAYEKSPRAVAPRPNIVPPKSKPNPAPRIAVKIVEQIAAAIKEHKAITKETTAMVINRLTPSHQRLGILANRTPKVLDS